MDNEQESMSQTNFRAAKPCYAEMVKTSHIPNLQQPIRMLYFSYTTVYDIASWMRKKQRVA